MKYLILALVNTIYGLLLLITLDNKTAGLYLMVFISAVLIVLGLWGLYLWFRQTIATPGAPPTAALQSWFQIIKGIDVLLVLGLLFRSFVLQPFLVDGNSMEPNYHNKQFLLVDRLSYRFATPKRGEVIIFRYPKNPSEDYIKRIVGLPGETLTIEDGQVYINNQLVGEKYIPSKNQTYAASSEGTFEQILGQKEYFVMGDNRPNSSDSRDWGILPRANFIGRAWFSLYPFSYFGKVQNPTYSWLPTLSKALTSPSLTWSKYW